MARLLAVTNKEADALKGELKLITPAHFDSFQLVLLTWYREEATYWGEIPNLLAFSYSSDEYVSLILRCAARAILNPNGEDGYDDEEEDDMICNILFNANDFQTNMMHDVVKILNALHLTYCYDYGMYGEFDYIEVHNEIVKGVW